MQFFIFSNEHFNPLFSVEEATTEESLVLALGEKPRGPPGGHGVRILGRRQHGPEAGEDEPGGAQDCHQKL